MSIIQNPFYKAEQAKREYEAYKANHANPFLLAAKTCAVPLVIGLALNMTGFLFTITIIGAIAGIPLILLGTTITILSAAIYPVALTLIYFQRLHQKAHNTK